MTLLFDSICDTLSASTKMWRFELSVEIWSIFNFHDGARSITDDVLLEHGGLQPVLPLDVNYNFGWSQRDEQCGSFYSWVKSGGVVVVGVVVAQGVFELIGPFDRFWDWACNSLIYDILTWISLITFCLPDLEATPLFPVLANCIYFIHQQIMFSEIPKLQCKWPSIIFREFKKRKTWMETSYTTSVDKKNSSLPAGH